MISGYKIKTHLIKPYENIMSVIESYCEFKENQILIISSKIVSLSEGRILYKDDNLSLKDILATESQKLYFSNNFATYTLIYFIKPGNGYYLDEVTITKLSSPTKSPSDTYYPTFSPSLGPTSVSPSFGPTTTRNCDQWVMNPGAERGDTSSWKV